MTEENADRFRGEFTPLFAHLSEAQYKLIAALLGPGKSLAEIGRAFDGVASAVRPILTQFLMSRRPEPLEEMERISGMFDRAASAGRKVLLASVRHVRG